MLKKRDTAESHICAFSPGNFTQQEKKNSKINLSWHVRKKQELINLDETRTLQTPQATVHSSDVAEAWLAWHSIPEETHTSVLQPPRPPNHTAEMRCMTISVCELTEIHDVVPTNSAVVYDDVPGPECNSIPLEKNNDRWRSYMIMLHCLCCSCKISEHKYKQTAFVVYILVNIPLLIFLYFFHNSAVVSRFLNKQS